MNSIVKKVELLANIAIILVAGLLGIVLIKNYLVKDSQFLVDQNINSVHNEKIRTGTTLTLPGINWSKQSKTLILAVSTTCHYCSESGPFYQHIAKEVKNTHLMAVLPQSVEESKLYLSKLGVSIDDVNQNTLSVLGVQGTPTLILVDNKGVVIDSWVGKLLASKEAEVLSKLD